MDNIYEKEISEFRNQINKIDQNLVKLLNLRFDTCLSIAKIKNKYHKNIIDTQRQQDILEKVKVMSKDKFKEENSIIYSVIMLMSSIIQLDSMIDET